MTVHVEEGAGGHRGGGIGAEGVGGTGAQRAGRDDGRPRVGIRTGQRERPGAKLEDSTGAGELSGKRHLLVAAAERKCVGAQPHSPAVGASAVQGSKGDVIPSQVEGRTGHVGQREGGIRGEGRDRADPQDAAAHGVESAEVVRPRENERSGSLLPEVTRPGESA